MTENCLLTHFERLADAPDAVKRLRTLIVALAVRGKLVPQLASEPPAGPALLAARKDLKARAVGTKRIRWKESEAVVDLNRPEPVPQGWALALVNDTGFYINGVSFKPSDWTPSRLMRNGR